MATLRPNKTKLTGPLPPATANRTPLPAGPVERVVRPRRLRQLKPSRQEYGLAVLQLDELAGQRETT